MHGKQTSLFDNLYIDHFAGGGGASTGIEIATPSYGELGVYKMSITINPELLEVEK